MAIPDPQSVDWHGESAVLLIHGVGDSKPGDYAPLVAKLENMLSGQNDRYAVYMFYYDYINEWFSQKTQAPLGVSKLLDAVRRNVDGDVNKNVELGNTIASFVGDVIWPVLSLDARDALCTAVLRQIRQIWLDAQRAQVDIPRRKLTIICHSLGCFHTFEALHRAARDPREQCGPAQGVQIENVIYMASPVKMIRTVASKIRDSVPQAESLACLGGDDLTMPIADVAMGRKAPMVRGKVVSITGNLDPVGGYFAGRRGDWAYMKLPNQVSRIDEQWPVTVNGQDPSEDPSIRAGLLAVLQASLQGGGKPPKISPQNPHDWTNYVTRYQSDLKQWLP